MTTRPYQESTTGRWGEEPFLARIAAYLNLAFGTWMHSVLKLHGFDEDLKLKNTSFNYGYHVRSLIPLSLEIRGS